MDRLRSIFGLVRISWERFTCFGSLELGLVDGAAHCLRMPFGHMQANGGCFRAECRSSTILRSGPYNPGMSRFVMEHLPRAAAVYDVTPLEYEEAKQWLHKRHPVSIIRTTEMIAAVQAALGYTLSQSDASVALQPGDEALLITLSFSVLLAWAEDNIAPLPEDWRCISLRVRLPEAISIPQNELVTSLDLVSEDPV